MTLLSRTIYISCVFIMLTGCSSAAKKAFNMSDFNKTMGTDTPEFILDYTTINITMGRYDESDYLRERTPISLCEQFSKKKNIERIHSKNLIANNLKCVGKKHPDTDLLLTISYAKEKCFLGCLDYILQYSNKNSQILAESIIEDMTHLDLLRFVPSHIESMVIAGALSKNKDNPEWNARFKSLCKNDKNFNKIC